MQGAGSTHALLLLLALPLPACTFDDTVAYLGAICESPSDCGGAPCVAGLCEAPETSCRAATPVTCAVAFAAPLAVCTCEGYVGSQPITIREGSFGSNGPVNGTPPLTVAGDLIVASGEGLLASGAGPIDVGGSLRSAGPVRSGGTLGVGGDMEAAGNVSVRSLTVAGTLRLPEGALLEAPDGQAVGSSVISAVAIEPPCACDATLPDAISSAVRSGRTENDNASIGLDPFALDGFEGATHLELPCGTFHVSRIAGGGALSLSITGSTTILVDGEVALDDDLEVEVAGGGHLTLVVEEDLRVAGRALLGSGTSTGRVDVLVGGGGTVSLGGATSIAGALIAPRGEVVHVAPLSLLGGALSARRIAAGGEITVRYDAALAEGRPECR